MTNPTPTDPAAYFREMLNQWEQMANQFGGQFMKSGEFAQTVHGATNAQLQMREAMHDIMARALAAANMPSREDVNELSLRLSAIEQRLASIEGMLAAGSGNAKAPSASDRPKPARTRKPSI